MSVVARGAVGRFGLALGLAVVLAGSAQAVDSVYTCGFETAEGYHSGALNGQQSWWADTDASVQSTYKSAGTYAARLLADGGFDGNPHMVAERYFTNPCPAKPKVTISQDVRIDYLYEADWWVCAYLGDALVDYTHFFYDGTMDVHGVSTAARWSAATWKTLVMTFDFHDGTLIVTYGGTQIYNGPIYGVATSGVDNVTLYTDDYFVGQTDAFTYDKLDVSAVTPPTLSISTDWAWMYQNAASTTGGRNKSVLTLTVTSDPYGNTTYTTSVTQNASSAGKVTIESTANPMVWNLKGGDANTDPVGNVNLDIACTGNQHGGTRNTTWSVTVRKLGDVDGGGTVNATDKLNFNKRLNGIATGFADRCYDLTGDGVINATDKLTMNRALNGIPIP